MDENLDLNEGSEIELAKEKENQSNINRDISLMREKIVQVDKNNKDHLAKTVEKTKIMKDIAARTIDLARSLELEADLMLKAAKENPNPEKKLGATQTEETPAAPVPGENPQA